MCIAVSTLLHFHCANHSERWQAKGRIAKIGLLGLKENWQSV
jgi:hypothetical protein